MIQRLQGILRWSFMHAEALFNQAFGDRLNPLYHLGPIAFFLFWIVAGSGLYLYVFFDTSVVGAYASVESLTHQQWFAGGILRSAHRYASDAMVVVMLVHMLRCFAFDRLRGFRSFSWITGVVLIWLVYISGANGFMLPWDRMAQFVLDATFEWMDWLPGFGGTLIRNVIYPSNLNDRFFSLLVFIHIGVPLMLLLMMWVHVQRVPKASMQPPRPIAISLLVTMLVMALVRPVVSQGGPADLSMVTPSLDLDWFYLGGYPLLYEWSPGKVWALVGLATLLLVVLPWLPLRRRLEKARDFEVSLRPGTGNVTARTGETLLEAGLRAGVALPYECRNGGCGACVCTVLHGTVDHGAFQPAVLTRQMRDEGKALMCCAVALSDLDIQVEGMESAGARPVRTYTGRIEHLEYLAEDVILLKLSLVEGARIDFTAGQYINIVLEDGRRRAFSFANAPHDNEFIELHVRHIPGGIFTTRVFTDMRVGDTLTFEGPFGHFTLREGDKPILFVAGATGFAPVKSILEDAFHRGIQRPLHLYWGVRERRDLYMIDLVERWQREYANFTVTPVLSGSGNDWPGRRGLVHEAMLADAPDLSGYEVYICGSVQMVDTAVPTFLAHGLSEDSCVSDAFLPAAK
ncbi:MAG TPA: 2Fe-2S iron-sulfur cluster-binding protein [Woeseiaceae bacterium]|nr:2Fe-2S iron-sulfur cluster-binding protein [Woeseiaceae bacterium]